MVYVYILNAAHMALAHVDYYSEYFAFQSTYLALITMRTRKMETKGNGTILKTTNYVLHT